MNFLEHLAHDYYQHQDFHVRANVRAFRRINGGWDAELDILAYQPSTKELVHVEPSWDAHTWDKRRDRFTRKFRYTLKEYEKISGYSITKVTKRAITGGALSVPSGLDWGDIEILTVPIFLAEVRQYLQGFHPARKAVPENLLCLRSMQFFLHYTKG